MSAGIDWSTSQSLRLGDNDFSPALVLSVSREPGSRCSGKRAMPSLSTPLSSGQSLCQ